jgi:Fumarylacetoacetate (FAA) hydrolase family
VAGFSQLFGDINVSELVIPPLPVACVPVHGGGVFPVRRIFCVGRNYADHAREMGHDPDREPPFFFTKPADAVLTGGADMPYPPNARSYITRLNSSLRFAPVARTFPKTMRYPSSGAMELGST